MQINQLSGFNLNQQDIISQLALNSAVRSMQEIFPETAEAYFKEITYKPLTENKTIFFPEGFSRGEPEQIMETVFFSNIGYFKETTPIFIAERVSRRLKLALNELIKKNKAE